MGTTNRLLIVRNIARVIPVYLYVGCRNKISAALAAKKYMYRVLKMIAVRCGKQGIIDRMNNVRAKSECRNMFDTNLRKPGCHHEKA
jgi:hypothetical protein